MNIGIDLGTTNTCASIFKFGKPMCIPIDGKELLPSVVYYKTKNIFTVGSNPNKYPFEIRHIKRIIGKSYYELDIADKTLPQYITEHHGKPYIKINDDLLSPETVSSHILLKVKSEVQNCYDKKINQIVITVPAYFDNRQRLATKTACHLAGLKVSRVINEPTAASLCYYLNKKNENIIVYDLGGGTLDVSLLEIDDDVLDVIATSGDTHLGGADIDMLIFKHISKRININQSHEEIQKILKISESWKIKLQTHRSIHQKVNNKPIFYTNKRLSSSIKKELSYRLKKPVHNVLHDSNIQPSNIQSVVFIGGSTRVSSIKKEISSMFPNSIAFDQIDPDKAVSFGASIQANMLSNNVSTQLQEHLLIDITPFSLGVRGINNEMIRIINRNETIPVSKTRTFTTTKDKQNRIDIIVYQGEDFYVTNCVCLGEFYLNKLPTAKKSTLSIDITFNLNNDGILEIIAYERSSKVSANLKLKI